ncbi:MAG: hypothetical protein K9J46_14940 [Saprospiraceae bacterium]|nr:hypothetical protein [Saprospiraceae bacterium]MCF8280779.1 hypothetical protein [Bacteroidales bacterium]
MFFLLCAVFGIAAGDPPRITCKRDVKRGVDGSPAAMPKAATTVTTTKA